LSRAAWNVKVSHRVLAPLACVEPVLRLWTHFVEVNTGGFRLGFLRFIEGRILVDSGESVRLVVFADD